MIAEQQPKSNTSIPTKTSFGQRFQTKAFKDSLHQKHLIINKK